MSRALIVNGFKNNHFGRQQFTKFRNNVTNSLQKLLTNPQIEIEIRTHTALHDFIFDSQKPGFPEMSGIRRFDGLDFIFIDGDDSILPWNPEAHPLLSLIQMGLATKKCMFLCGPSMQCMAYLSVCGLKFVDFGNSFRKRAPKKFHRMIGKDTGDILDYVGRDAKEHEPGSEWKRSKNIGMKDVNWLQEEYR